MNAFAKELNIKDGYSKVDIHKAVFSHIKEFGVISLESGRRLKMKSEGCETGLVIFGGTCDIVIDGRSYKGLGKRIDVFDGLPTGVYIPLGSQYEITGYGVQIGSCRAGCDKRTEASIIPPEKVKVAAVGRDNWSREVRTIIGPDSPSVNLILGETMNPAGNWSGTPPHRHERSLLPKESLHEELYYFRTGKPEGFGIERIYSPEREKDVFLLLKNNTVTFMPWGYHQIVAGPGYKIYYMFFLAGEGKSLTGYVDPEHKWLMENKR